MDRSEPEPDVTSDRVLKPATLTVPEGLLVEFEGMTWRPLPSAAGEDGALIDWESECILPISLP